MPYSAYRGSHSCVLCYSSNALGCCSCSNSASPTVELQQRTQTAQLQAFGDKSKCVWIWRHCDARPHSHVAYLKHTHRCSQSPEAYTVGSNLSTASVTTGCGVLRVNNRIHTFSETIEKLLQKHQLCLFLHQFA